MKLTRPPRRRPPLVGRVPRIDGAMTLIPVYAFATDAVGRRRIKGHE